MDDDPVEQVVNELFPYFEALETRSAAILQLLKDKGLTSDEQFAPYLEQAANGSNVKWLAARIRVLRLLSSKVKAEKDKDIATEEEAKTKPASAEQTTGTSAEQNSEQKEVEKAASKSTEPDAKKTIEELREQVSQNTVDSDANTPAQQPASQDTRNEITQASDKNRNSNDSGARSQANTVPKKSAEKKSQ